MSIANGATNPFCAQKIRQAGSLSDMRSALTRTIVPRYHSRSFCPELTVDTDEELCEKRSPKPTSRRGSTAKFPSAPSSFSMGRSKAVGIIASLQSDPTAHAEIVALQSGREEHRKLSAEWRRSIFDDRAVRDVRRRYGSRAYRAGWSMARADPKAGAVDSHFGICTTDFLNHRVRSRQEGHP